MLNLRARSKLFRFVESTNVYVKYVKQISQSTNYGQAEAFKWFIFFSLNCTNQFICCFEFQRRKKVLLFFSFCFCVLPHCLSLNSPVFLFRFFFCFSFSKNTNAHASRAKNNNPKQKTWTHYVTISAVLVSIYTPRTKETTNQKYNHFDFTRRCC